MKTSNNESLADNSIYLPFIDGIRGVAVLLVLLVHTSQFVANNIQGRFYFKLSELFVNWGARGVQLFFIVSAFTLFNSAQIRNQKDKKSLIIGFYLRRIFRIFPFWIFMVVLMTIIKGGDFKLFFLNITFLFGFVRFIPGVELIEPAWTLFIEETFYLLFPLYFVNKMDFSKALSFFFYLLIFSMFWYTIAPKINVPITNDFIFLFPFTWYFVFALGILIYYVIEYIKPSLNNLVFGKALDIFTIIFLFLSIILNKADNWYYFSVLFSTFSLAIFFICCSHKRTVFRKIVSIGILKRSGIYCYSIYLFHQPLLTLLDPLKNLIFNKFGIDDFIPEVQLLFYFPVVIFICLIIGGVTFKFIEKPSVILGKIIIARFVHKIH